MILMSVLGKYSIQGKQDTNGNKTPGMHSQPSEYAYPAWATSGGKLYRRSTIFVRVSCQTEVMEGVRHRVPSDLQSKHRVEHDLQPGHGLSGARRERLLRVVPRKASEGTAGKTAKS